MSSLLLPSSLIEELAEERARELVSATRADAAPIDFPIAWTTNRSGTGLGQAPTARRLLAEQRGWSQIANQAIMKRVSSLEWSVGERTFDEDTSKFKITLDPDDPVNELLHRPNPYLSGRLLKWILSGLVMQTGGAYLQKLRDGVKITRQLWPIPTQMVEPIACDGLVVGGYRVTNSDGLQTTLPVDDVIRVWQPDLLTMFGQLGALEPQAIEYDASKALQQHLQSFYESDATPRVALLADNEAEPPGENTPERERFKRSWRMSNDRTHGTDRGIPAFLPPGFNVHEFSEQDQSSSVDLSSAWAKQMMAAFGTPAFAVGVDTNVNRATGETSMWAWDQNTIKPLTDLIADAFTTQLMPEFGSNLLVAFEDFVAPDKEFELSRDKQNLDEGVITVNEVRKRDGSTDVSWGDLPRGTIADAPYTGEDRFPAPTVQPRNKFVSAELLPLRTLPMFTRADLGDPDAMWQRNVAIDQRWLSQWGRAQIDVWAIQLELTLVNLARVSGVPLADLRSDQSRGPSSADEIFGFSTHQINADIYLENIAPLRTDLYSESAEEVVDALTTKSFVLTEAMKEQVARIGAEAVTEIDGTTRGLIQDVLNQAITEGDSIGTIAKNLQPVFLNRNRARAVARTEVGKTNQTATMEGFRTSNVVEDKMWNTSRDGVVRPSHQIDGQVRAIDAQFDLRSGARADSPLDPRLDAADVVNCRCFVTPVLFEDPTEAI